MRHLGIKVGFRPVEDSEIEVESISVSSSSYSGETIDPNFAARDWNKEFQEILKKNDSLEKFVDLRTFASDFIVSPFRLLDLLST